MHAVIQRFYLTNMPMGILYTKELTLWHRHVDRRAPKVDVAAKNQVVETRRAGCQMLIGGSRTKYVAHRNGK